jgi:hypothetical protein
VVQHLHPRSGSEIGVPQRSALQDWMRGTARIWGENHGHTDTEQSFFWFGLIWAVTFLEPLGLY